MMAYQYTTRNGQRLEIAVSAAFDALNNAFHAVFGLWLVINSGTRTDAEQEAIFRERYTLTPNGRKVYDTRWWQGRLWYRISAAGTVAPPGSSNHQESGPNGPRSFDISDTGGDPGVMTRGTARDRWMEANAGRFQIENEGYNFNEPWHKTFRGVLGSVGSPAGGTPDETVRAQQNWLNHIGINVGEADGIIGPLYIAGVKAYQEQLRADGYTGAIDGQWGPATQAAHAIRYARETNPPANGSGFPAFPLPDGQWFGWEQGGDSSISGWYSNRDKLKLWQQRMIDRGWDLGPDGADGLYGPKGQTRPEDSNTGRVVLAFQKEKGYTVDGQIGRQTWDGAWTAPVTPSQPETPTTPPTTPEQPAEPSPDEASATPALVSPTAADFPSWVRFEIVHDRTDFTEKPTLNLDAQKYYGKPYAPLEVHAHWWGKPDGSAGTHDGNVNYLSNTKDTSANFVSSPGRVTMMVPLNKIALTTGQRNPYAWKVENDPKMTLPGDNGELGYLTLAVLIYVIEKLNPTLRNEQVRLHKEFYSTTCSEIDAAKVRRLANGFHDGTLDFATGKPVTEPQPEPEPEDPSLHEQIATKYRELGDLLEKLPEE
jgi:peptidoglycan hydrolase-like protein with peptidoglycan-binding domain